MRASFDKAYDVLAPIEGGYVNDPRDYGGETRYGISKRNYPDIDITKLTRPDAKEIIRRDFWGFYNIGDIVDQEIANLILLALVHMNPIKAGKIVQAAVNGCGLGTVVVVVDGIIGSQTIRAINLLAARWLSDRIRMEACRYYLRVVDKDQSQNKFFKGWIRRALA